MNEWLVALLVVGLAIGLVVGASALSNDTKVPKTSLSCGNSCGNSCTEENNCGLATCGATQGKTCNCGK